MSKNRSRRIDRDTAEQLLGGGPVGPEAGADSLTGHAALAGLLAAVAAPAAGGVLPGEEQAVAAFREARRSPEPHPGRAAMADTARRRAFTVKALVAAFAVTAVGGVAVAAGTGGLPRVLGGGPAVVRTPQGGPSASSGHGPVRTDGRSAGASAPGTPGTSGPSAGSGPSASPAAGPADLAGLCRELAVRTAAGGKLRELLADPSMAPLVAAAGKESKVVAYCRAVHAVAAESAAPAAGSPAATTGSGSGGQQATPTPTPSPTKSRRTAEPARPDLTDGSAGAAVR
ncbi:hypothetical protein KNE206_72660 [Kitasatospora sp. NE20-6]|uniref:hypothetical protein n=1 Tax=Kitasatospora sp. NE20-6 TaxID=2859066 RepID=UPI0034DBF4E1